MRLPRYFVFCTALAVSHAPLADVESGLKAMNAGSYELAYERFLSCADKGDSAAQYYLATLYAEGRGVLKDMP